MSRTNQKGTDFETLVARGFAEALNDDGIERRARTGALDRGDIAGLRFNGHRLVVECKNVLNGKAFSLPEWVQEAQVEALNDGALVGVVVHKRKGSRQFRDQWVSMTVADFLAILTGEKQ